MEQEGAQVRPAEISWLRRPWLILALGLFGVLAIVLLVFWALRAFHGDEFEAIHTAWKVTQGEWIYSGFFQHHHPLLYFMLAPVVGVFGDGLATLFVCRVLMIGVGLGTLLVTYRLSLRYLKDRVAATCSVLLMLLFLPLTHFGLQVRPDAPMVLLEILSLAQLHDFLVLGRRRGLVLSAVSLALAFLFLQKAMIFFLLSVVLLGIGWMRRRVRLVHLLAYLGIYTACLAPFYLVLLLQGELGQYFELTWLVNHKMWQGLQLTALNTMGQALIASLPAAAFFFIGTVTGRRTPHLWQPMLLVLGLILAAALAPLVFLWDLIPAFPLMSLVGAQAVVTMMRKLPRLSRVVVLLLIPITAWHLQSYLGKLGGLSTQLAKVSYLTSLTAPQETVYDASMLHYNLYRKDVDYFWYNVGGQGTALGAYQELTGYHYDPAEIIDRTRPRWICLRIPFDLSGPTIAEHYLPSPWEEFAIRSDSAAAGP